MRWISIITRFFSNSKKWRQRFDSEMLRLGQLPTSQRFADLAKLGQEAMRLGDVRAADEVLEMIGALGTDDSARFIADWLDNRTLEMTWPSLLKGILRGAEEAQAHWKGVVFRALEGCLDISGNTHLFSAWPFVSWPSAMVAISPHGAVDAFAKRGLLSPGALGFATALTAINESPHAVVPAEIAATWLPPRMPDSGDASAMEEYLLQLKAHAHHDLAETKRRLWEMVESGGCCVQEAASSLLRIERLPDPVWKLDTRIQEIGLDHVRPAERVVWIVANWFTFPIRTSGFDRFVVGYEADHLPETIEALTQIGATATARCLREWSQMFGNEWPRDRYQRENMIENQHLEPGKAWAAATKSACRTENVILLNLYYQFEHADQFEQVM